MQKVKAHELVEGQKYYLQDKFNPNNIKMGILIDNKKNSAPLFKVSNITINGKVLYNGYEGEQERSNSNTYFFKPRKEEIINASLQRQALQQTFSSLLKNKDKDNIEIPKDIEKYTASFLDGKFLPKKKQRVVSKNIKHCLYDAQTNEKIIKPIKINVNIDLLIDAIWILHNIYNYYK
jgi:hypothetical protein